MISRLRGTILDNDGSKIVIDVSGVGYEVQIPGSLGNLPKSEDCEVTVFVRQTFREDGVTLYAFADELERRVFDLLTEVKGCGPRTALNVLSEIGAEATIETILRQDGKTLCRASGVGPRLAERIFVELKDKVGEERLNRKIAGQISNAAVQLASPQDELVEALLALGFKRNEVESAAEEARREEEGIADQLRFAIRSLRK